MSKTRIETAVRWALYEAYNHKCFYCDKPIEWNCLEIDHIIPETYEKHLDTIIDMYGLEKDFNINSLQNLAPAHSSCNRRKSDILANSSSVRFWLMLTKQNLHKVEKEIKRIKKNANFEKITSAVECGLEYNELNIKELYFYICEQFLRRTITLNNPVLFQETSINTFIIGQSNDDVDNLVIEIPEGIYGLKLVNESNESKIVYTLKEWRSATKNGFYAFSSYDIKMSSYFSFLDELLVSIENAQNAKHSFIDGVHLSDIDKLSSNIFRYFQIENKFDENISMKDLNDNKEIKVTIISESRILIESESERLLLEEQYRADITRDGYKDIFIKGGFSLIGGTLGFSFTMILSRTNENSLIAPVFYKT